VNCAKTAKPIEMPFGVWTRVGPRKHELTGIMGVHIDATWRIQLNHLCAETMRPFCQITLNTCLWPPYVIGQTIIFLSC